MTMPAVTTRTHRTLSIVVSGSPVALAASLAALDIDPQELRFYTTASGMTVLDKYGVSFPLTASTWYPHPAVEEVSLNGTGTVTVVVYGPHRGIGAWAN